MEKTGAIISNALAPGLLKSMNPQKRVHAKTTGRELCLSLQKCYRVGALRKRRDRKMTATNTTVSRIKPGRPT